MSNQAKAGALPRAFQQSYPQNVWVTGNLFVTQQFRHKTPSSFTVEEEALPENKAATFVAQVAVPVPVRKLFDYAVTASVGAGMRVRVPFGSRQLVGMVLAVQQLSSTAVPLKSITAQIDQVPLFTAAHLALLIFMADYYHYPVGEVIFAALPAGLKWGAPKPTPLGYCLTTAGRAIDASHLGRSKRRQQLWQALVDKSVLSRSEISALGSGLRPFLAEFLAAGWVVEAPCFISAPVVSKGPVLRADQDHAYRAVAASWDGFQSFLLYGVTGSGKTEVYLQLILDVMARGKQALVLVPEIGLTPQLIERFTARLGPSIGLLHSGCRPAERARVFLAAAAGDIAVVVGTRSAVFVPLKAPGLIIVDEEHDGSFKQQEGLRYQARDMAVLRAKREGIPIVLGSATPSLESYRHAQEGRYQLLPLRDRGAMRTFPSMQVVDLATTGHTDGLSPVLVERVAATLARGEQALLFLNRRGYAPVLFCPACRWHAPCERCDARLTVHWVKQHLRCHHCGLERPIPTACPACGHLRLLRVGEGTERLEEALRRQFPIARIARIDRDTVVGREAFADIVQRVHAGDIDILVGTQMLAKGHDFPKLTLVGIVNADQGLYGTDFRADEQLFAQVVQVAGRAGRGDYPGEVFIQTYHPTHRLWAAVCALDYESFAQQALADRKVTGFPPYTYCALLRAEARDPQAPLAFLQAAQGLMHLPTGLSLGDPVPAPMGRRAGFHRAQLLMTCTQRVVLQRWLTEFVSRLATVPHVHRVRWSLDVDPYSLF